MDIQVCMYVYANVHNNVYVCVQVQLCIYMHVYYVRMSASQTLASNEIQYVCW